MKSGRFKVPLIYIAIGILWIVLSDSAILWVSQHIDHSLLRFLIFGKGVFLVLCTAIVLFLLIDNERKKLDNNNRQYRKFYEDNPNPIWFYDPITFRFTSVNDAAIAYYGYTRAEFLSMTIMDIRPPEDSEKVKDSYLKMTRDLHESGIWRHLKKDGTLIYVYITSHKTTQNNKEIVMVMANDTTEKYLYEQRLQEINQELTLQKAEVDKNYLHLENTLNSITDSFVTINRNWTFTKANLNFYTVTGVKEDVIGKSIDDVFPDSAEGAFRQLAIKAMDDNQPGNIEDYSPMLKKWLRSSVFPTDEGIAIYFSDITAEKEKDIQLKLALERYDLASHATGEVIYDLDLVNDTLVFNTQIGVLLDISGSDVSDTMSWWKSVIHPEDIAVFSADREKRIAAGEKYWLAEYRIMTNEIDYKHISDHGYLIFDEDDKPVRLIGAIKDIDLLKRSTEQLKRTGEILNKINNPVIISNAEGIVIWVNPAFSAVTGYMEHEVMGRDHAGLLYNLKTNKIIAQQLLRAVAAKESFSAELLNYDKYNREYWVSLNLYPIFDAQGRFECYISVQNDITEHKEREAVIGIQNEKLKAVSWLNSHEIRKPVASILALAQLMKSAENEDEKSELLELLFRCAVELDDIIMEINAEASGHIRVK